MKLKIVFILIISFFGIHLFAQNNDGEIIGKVVDSVLNEPLFFAGISLEQNGIVVEQTEADGLGKFYFKPVKPGVYEIKISFTGYAMKTFSNLKVRPNEMNYFVYQLSSSNVLPTAEIFPDEIIIDPLLGDVIDLSKIKLTPPGSPQEIVLRERTDIYSEDGGENGVLMIQGSRPDATLYVVDGIRIDGSTYIPKNAILNIVVYAGGIPAKYGDVTGGVIEITTRSYSGIY